MYYTAQIKESNGHVIAVTATPAPLDSPPSGVVFVTLNTFDTSVANKKYENGQFVDIVEESP